MATEEAAFRLVHSTRVKDTILAIAEKAKGFRPTSLVKTHLLRIAEKLAIEPEKWGDPLYAAQKQGGTVYRGYLFPCT